MVKLKIEEHWEKVIIIFLLLFFIPIAFGTENSKPASVLLQEGLYAEEVEGNLDEAIKIYQQIIDDSSTQKNLMAQALYRQGMCYMKLQNDNQAKQNFTKLVTDFSDQTNIIEKVRPLLDDISNADPAALMPPETLLYAEIGSPGKQIETILNMLKGSPLENPLELIGENVDNNTQDQVAAAQVFSALLNPNMMTEFKKIRGMGVGITGIPQNDIPPAIAVIFPGKSDALKAILQMALTLAGKPTQKIEGMQCVAFEAGGGAAYDDSVIILATPLAFDAGQLTWCVKQYKGITNEPTLASNNKSFAQVSKQARQSNVLTIWADLNTFYNKLMEILPPDAVPAQLHMVNGVVDFENIKELIASLSLEQTGISIESNIALKDGHNCIAYNMIRTPNLNKKAFRAVPQEAIGLLSLALNDAESVQAATVGQQLKNITGLDFGREIFTNIEQVTLFLTSSENTTMQGNNPMLYFAPRIGLAITSRNPQQTSQIINQILRITGLLVNNSANNQAVQGTGKYEIELTNGMRLNCYQDQSNKMTLIAMGPDIIDASIASLQSGKSILTAGPLQKSLSAMSPNTSKMLVFNVGGVLGQIVSNVAAEEQIDNLHTLLTKTAEGFKDTTLQIRTNENLNNFNIRASINDLPPASVIFPQIMQIASIMSQINAGNVRTIPVKSLVIAHTDQPLIITDEIVPKIWKETEAITLKNTIYTAPSSKEDLSAEYKVLWDKDNLYVYVNVIDDKIVHDSEDFYQDDSVEIFVDADDSKSGEYDDNDYHFFFSWNNNGIHNRGSLPEGIQAAMQTGHNGYDLRVTLPWSVLGVKPQSGVKIGLDIHVNDDDDGGERDSKITWNDPQDVAWQNTKYFGTAELKDIN